MLNKNININSYNLDEILNCKKIKEIKSILLSKQINLELCLDKESFYRGYCIEDKSGNFRYIIHVNIQESLKEDINNFNRRGALGDVFNPEVELFIPNNKQDLGEYSIIYTILHEYKHYLQYINGRLDNIDISLDENNKYIDNKAIILEEEAELFALENIQDVMKNNYICFN